MQRFLKSVFGITEPFKLNSALLALLKYVLTPTTDTLHIGVSTSHLGLSCSSL
jgi:hypothetical protein